MSNCLFCSSESFAYLPFEDIILSKIKQIGGFKSKLNFVGFGGGRFLFNAMAKGYEDKGEDFSNELTNNIENAYPPARFQEIESFYIQNDIYEVIFTSNVFEHLINPLEVLHNLVQRIHPNEILVLDGSIENNFMLAGTYRKILFGIRKKMGKIVSHIPRHIIYANAKNQRQFFEQPGLETLSYKLEEIHCPFPMRWQTANDIKAKYLLMIAKISKTFGSCLPNNGNIFYFIGRKKSS